jgi:hypothetical protein
MLGSAIPIRPGAVIQANAGSFVQVPFACVDRQMNAVTPSAIRYRYDNLTDSVVLADWASTSAVQSGTISITAAQNAMTRDWRRRQMNQVTIEYTTASGVYQETKLVELFAVLQGAA